MGLFQRGQHPQTPPEPVRDTPVDASPMATLFAALGWWMDSEGVRDFTILDTPTGGVFIKGMRPRLHYRSTATEVVTEHFDTARLTRLIDAHQAAMQHGHHKRGADTHITSAR
jgi:hypothetical protein